MTRRVAPRWLIRALLAAITGTASLGGAVSAANGPGQTTGQSQVAIGLWSRGTATTVTIEANGSTQSIPTTRGTRYDLVVRAFMDALTVGRYVSIVPDPHQPSTAQSVTVAAPGRVHIIVVTNAASGSGSGSTHGVVGAPGSGNGQTGGSVGQSGGVSGPAGTIISRNADSMMVRGADGYPHTVHLSATTVVYRVVPATRGQFHAGAFTLVTEMSDRGKPVAAEVVQTTIAGTTLAPVIPGQ